MKKLKYEIKKIPVSKEEKLERVKFYMEETGFPVDVESFLNKEIYDEYVEMKCIKCGYEATLDFDILQEMMEFCDSDYPEVECPNCSHDMVPKDIYFELKKKKHK